MALSEATLSAALKAEFDKYSDDVATSASNLATAYANWGAAGMFGVNTIGSMAALQTALQGALLTGFNAQTLASFGNAWSTGLTAWAGIPVVGVNVGAVISCPGAASLASSIPAALASYPSSTQEAADTLAGLLFTATMTCTALLASVPPPPPTFVLPIS